MLSLGIINITKTKSFFKNQNQLHNLLGVSIMTYYHILRSYNVDIQFIQTHPGKNHFID